MSAETPETGRGRHRADDASEVSGGAAGAGAGAGAAGAEFDGPEVMQVQPDGSQVAAADVDEFDGAEGDGADFDGAGVGGSDLDDADVIVGEGFDGSVTDEERLRAMRSNLDAFALEDEDVAIIGDDGEFLGFREPVAESLPVVAIVGRPNVGKSALVNRILGRREAVVEDVPGVTRDRVTYQAEWVGTRFSLVDTGGWEPDAKGIDASVALQAEVAIELCDVVMFVVDSRVGPTATDERVVQLLRRTKKPVFLVANKVDDAVLEAEAAQLWSLGLGEPHAVSALHGRGVADLLDQVVEALPEESAVAQPKMVGPRRVALLGRPNVGKSSLLNKAAGEERAVVSDIAGTTRDPVDEQVEIAGRVWTFVDTAGIRRRVHLQKGADFYASLRTATALEKAEVAVVLIDVTQSISDQDLRIIDLVLESGRALVLAFNKWDLLDDDRRRYLEREIDQDLAHVDWAPRVNISARTGRHLEKLVPALEQALESWDTRIPTAKFNAFVAELVQEHPHPLRSGKQPRILFGTQVQNRPPTFVLFTSGFLDPQYRRFIQRRLRERYGFEGSPIQINMRIRERRPRP
ncbi:ribosome biogenesis GTPase Der [Leucobacter sp. USHLN153]|uniref:ribosome biogenesis GTPase Der n=1 Tax=Leucobacter sp. USHLN153 TaxID=3081268 RepID=UPI003FA52D45